jgi:hypothetical protein
VPREFKSPSYKFSRSFNPIDNNDAGVAFHLVQVGHPIAVIQGEIGWESRSYSRREVTMNAITGTIRTSDRLHVTAPDAAGSVDIWLDEVTRLYLLSFLLTADKVLAEKCFSNAMDDFVASRGVTLADWAGSAGRAAVILRAVQTMRPTPKRVHSWSFVPGSRPLVTVEHQPFSAITGLGAFERFVFVIAVLEGYSAEECAAFLECGLSDVAAPRDLADTLIPAADTEDGFGNPSETLPLAHALIHQHSAIC